jgi:hypothetical protein
LCLGKYSGGHPVSSRFAMRMGRVALAAMALATLPTISRFWIVQPRESSAPF